MLNVSGRVLMSASSTSSSTSCSQEEAEPTGGEKNVDDGDSTLKKRMHQYGVSAGYANSSMSTLDRSQYQSLPLGGTRRVTVQFGRMKIVVPWKETDSTVGQLADAALVRYKKARGMASDEPVRVLRLECASDGGIMDMDDILEEVFDLNYDQILAITDESNGSATPTYSQVQKRDHHYAQPLPYSRKHEGSSTPVASAFGSVSVNHQAHRSASPYNVGYAHSSSRNGAPSSVQKDRRDSVVEVNGFDSVPPTGLRVFPAKEIRPRDESMDDRSQKPILRSSLRTEASVSRPMEDATPTKQPRVTLSPEVEKKLAEQEGDERKSERRRHYEKNPGRFNRGSDRKSRIDDVYLERLADKLENSPPEAKKRKARAELVDGPYPGTTIITFPLLEDIPDIEDSARQMGIEVNAVFDEELSMPSTSNPAKLSAVQVMKIEENGRVAKDGRIRVGDSIREIDGRPVSQMSIIRARAYIADLSVSTRDVTLLVNRSVQSFLEQEAEEKAAAEAKPILSALQQANTQYIGHTTIVELIKSPNGFGFTVTGRETAKGERLFYIGTVKPYGVALGHLKSGDRLLEINGDSTGQWTQSEIVDKLKEIMVGAKTKFLVSRVSQSVSVNTSLSSENKENEGTPKVEEKKEEVQKLPLPALLTPPVPKDSPSPSASGRFEIVIPVNGSGSAGLGVSLKARVSKKSNGTKDDCGIFIKNVMHGGAAFKEGHLRVDDRIVGVEDVDLEVLSNTEASHALARKLKDIGPTSPYVKLTVVRNEYAGSVSRDSSRYTVDAPSPAPSSRMSTITAPNSLLQSPQARATSSSGVESSHSRESSSASSSMPAPRQTERDSVVSDNARLDESDMPETDPFDREAPGRKSLSEKRGLGAAADPQHIKLFQEIKHQRQNSAPTASTQKRSKSQPRSLSQRNYRSPMKLIDLPQAQALQAASTLPRQQTDDPDMLNRRSQSMESINRPVESILRGTGQVTQNSSSKVQFMQNVGPNQHPFPPGSPLMRLKSEESRARDKNRRKSVGSAMRNFFGFGSKSRDASPEKAPQPPVHLIERPRPIVEERTKNMIVVPPPPPPHKGPRRGSAGGVYVDYGEPYGLIPQYPHNTSQTLAADGIRLISYTKNGSPPPPLASIGVKHPVYLGNSKFYSSYREPSLTQRPRLPDTSRTPTLNSTTDTRLIATNRPEDTMRMSTSTDNRAALRSTRRPMSTMDYQHLMRTMSMPEYHRPAEASQRPRCVVSTPSTTRMNQPISISHPQPDTVKVAAVDATTTTTCSTPGSHTRVEVRSAPRPSSSPRTVPRQFESPLLRPSNGASPLSNNPVRRPRPLTVADAVSRPAPSDLPQDHPVLINRRRRSMQMLDLENSPALDRPACLFPDTAVVSVQRRSPPTSVPTTKPRVVEDLPVRRANTGGETMDRLIVFPSTRFPIAPSAMRVTSATKPLSNSVNLRPVPNNNSSANERISLRARKKLHREAVTRSEFYLPPNSNENILLFNSLLPPSTSSIMTTTPLNGE